MGYINYSMSERALESYENGLKPISKWTKEDILEELTDITEDKKEVLRKAPKKALKRLLTSAEWHHTGKYFNKTDFYEVNHAQVEDLTLEELKQLLTVEKEKPVEEYKAVCKYLVWGGTRNHPKATEMESTWIIRGNWFYLENGTKKSINANGFEIVKKL